MKHLNIDLEENNFDYFLSGKTMKHLKKKIGEGMLLKFKACGEEYKDRVKSGKSKMKMSKKKYIAGCVKRFQMELNKKIKEKSKKTKERIKKEEQQKKDDAHLERYTSPIAQQVSNEKEGKKNKYATLLLAGGALIAVIVVAKFIK